MSFDLIIRNAKIVDGTGASWFRGDLAVKSAKIAHIGKLPQNLKANLNIDARDRYLMPGFIDIHTHSDFELLREPDAAYKLRQGVTTQVIGQCGYSAAPVVEDRIPLIDQHVGFIKAGVEPDWNWRSFGEWMDVLASLPLGTNVAGFVGHSTIRTAVLGFESRSPCADELKAMTDFLTDSLAQGAMGLTSGLIYPPGVYAKPQEIVHIASGLSSYNALYESHMRSESDDLIESIKETIIVGEKNGIPVQISHFKAAGRQNWGMVQKALSLVDQARARGVDVSLNQYPYDSASSTLRAILPNWVHEGGVKALLARLKDQSIRKRLAQEIKTTTNWDNFYLNSDGPGGIILLYFAKTPEYEGKTLEQAADLMGKDPIEAAFDLIITNDGIDTCAFSLMSEEDVSYVLSHPAVMVASDSIPAPPGSKNHPRTYGTFPKVLDWYVNQRKLLRLEEAVRKMTSLPAQRLGFTNKGVLKKNLDADLVLVDMDRIRDNASFKCPSKACQGIDLVVVNGRVAMENGRVNTKGNGKVILNSQCYL